MLTVGSLFLGTTIISAFNLIWMLACTHHNNQFQNPWKTRAILLSTKHTLFKFILETLIVSINPRVIIFQDSLSLSSSSSPPPPLGHHRPLPPESIRLCCITTVILAAPTLADPQPELIPTQHFFLLFSKSEPLLFFILIASTSRHFDVVFWRGEWGWQNKYDCERGWARWRWWWRWDEMVIHDVNGV